MALFTMVSFVDGNTCRRGDSQMEIQVFISGVQNNPAEELYGACRQDGQGIGYGRHQLLSPCHRHGKEPADQPKDCHI